MFFVKNIFRVPKTITAIELNEVSVKIINLTITKDEKIAVQNYQIIPVMKNNKVDKNEIILDLWIEILQKQLKKIPSKKQKIYISISCRESIFQKLVFPKLNNQELKAAIKWDLVEYLPKTIDNYYYDYLVLDEKVTEDEEQKKVLFWAVEKNIVDKLRQSVKSAKLELHLVIIDIFAVISLISSEKKDFVLLEINTCEFTISIIKDSLPIEQKIVKITTDIKSRTGSEFFVNKGFEREGAPFDKLFLAKQLAQEICSLLELVAKEVDRTSLTEIIVYGELAKLIVEEEVLDKQTGLKITLLNPWEKIEMIEQDELCEKSILENQFNCSLSLVSETSKIERFNLIPVNKLPLSWLEKGVIIVTLLVCVFATFCSCWERHKNYEEFKKITETQLEVGIWEKRAQTLATVKKNYEQRAEIIEKHVDKRNDWYKIFLHLGYFTPDTVKIISLVQDTDNQYLLTIEAPDIAILSNYLGNLEKENVTKKTKIQSIEQNQVIQAKIKFIFTGVRNEKSKTNMGKNDRKK